MISALIIPTLADSKGRYNIFLIGLFVNTCAITVMIFSKNFWLTGFCLFVNGLSITSRWGVGCILLLEFMPLKIQPIVGGFMQAGGAMPLVIGTILTMTTNNTQWMLFLLITVNVVGLICLMVFKMLPESPAWLYD